MRTLQRAADHLQRPGHSNFLDLAALGETALEVYVLETGKRMLDAVPFAIACELIGIELPQLPHTVGSD